MLLGFAAAAAYGVLFRPSGGFAKYSPPVPWEVIHIESGWARSLIAFAFVACAVALLRLASRAAKRG